MLSTSYSGGYLGRKVAFMRMAMEKHFESRDALKSLTSSSTPERSNDGVEPTNTRVRELWCDES
jgi:hypothetical protein